MRRDAPTVAEARGLLVLEGAPVALVAHCEAVHHVAVAIAKLIRSRGQALDMALVEAGAVLHDIGRSRTQGLDHASVGAQILRDLGYSEALCLVVERHTGGGIDASEASQLGLPIRDYTPKTMEERIVCQADNLVDGNRRQKVQEELDALRERGLAHVALKIDALHRDLSRLAGRDLDEIR